MVQLASDSALGPKWLSTSLLQIVLVYLKTDVVAAIKEIFAAECMPEIWKTTFIKLIPNKGVKEAKDYHPINLCRTLCKLVSKILVDRVK